MSRHGIASPLRPLTGSDRCSILADMAQGEKLKNAFVWIMLVIGAFLYGPYLLGGLYAVAALPVFSVICGTSSNPLSFVREPISYGDYQQFLYGQGCKLSPPTESMGNPSSGLGYITPEYMGQHPFFSDDVVSNLFANIGRYWKRVFLEGAMNTADAVTAALRTSTSVRALFYLGYILVAAIAVKLLSNAVDHVWRQFFPK